MTPELHIHKLQPAKFVEGVLVAVDPILPPPPIRICIHCKWADKRKDDYDFMCSNPDVTGVSLVTGGIVPTFAWFARSVETKCGKSAKYYEPSAPAQDTISGGQAQDASSVDAPTSNTDVLPSV